MDDAQIFCRLSAEFLSGPCYVLTNPVKGLYFTGKKIDDTLSQKIL